MDESQNDYAKTKNKQKGILFDFIQVKCYKTQTESRLVVVQGESMMGRGGGGKMKVREMMEMFTILIVVVISRGHVHIYENLTIVYFK